MAVTVKREAFVATFLTRTEHAQVVRAARTADISLAAFVRQAVVQAAACASARARREAEQAVRGAERAAREAALVAARQRVTNRVAQMTKEA